MAFGLVLWMISPFAILWSIWKRKNDRIFRALSLSVEEMEHLVFFEDCEVGIVLEGVRCNESGGYAS